MTERTVNEVLEEGCAMIMADPDNHAADCCARGTCCYSDGIHPRIRWSDLIPDIQTTTSDRHFDMEQYRYDEPCTGACICACAEWVENFKIAVRAAIGEPQP